MGRWGLLAVLLSELAGGVLLAGEETVKPELPVDREALAKLERLGANEAVTLGKAKVVGEFNEVAKRFRLDQTGPMGRDFTIKMVWAEDRKRVLFCGANHRVPHRLNDVWEFDLAAMTWAMLYAPDNDRDYLLLGKDYSDVEFRDGVLITKRGGPGIIGHTWWGLTYDPEQKKMLFLNTWVTEEKKAVELLGGNPEQLYQGPPLWEFTPATGQWKVLKTEEPYPWSIFGGMLEYIPDFQGTIWHSNNWQMQATWLYEAKSSSWKNLKSNGDAKAFESEAAEPEQVGYYDPQRHQLIIHRHKSTHHYDVKTNAWKKVLTADKDSSEVPYGHDAFSPMYYDPVSGHGLLVEFKTNTLWAYDPEAVRWTKQAPQGDPMPTGGKRLAYVDPLQNVFVILDGITVWAWRYQAKLKP